MITDIDVEALPLHLDVRSQPPLDCRFTHRSRDRRRRTGLRSDRRFIVLRGDESDTQHREESARKQQCANDRRRIPGLGSHVTVIGVAGVQLYRVHIRNNRQMDARCWSFTPSGQ
jgi:hypothetical protein